jgi:hypothetical protein
VKVQIVTIDELYKSWPTQIGKKTRPLVQIERKGRKQKIDKPVRPTKTVNSPTRKMGESW